MIKKFKYGEAAGKIIIVSLFLFTFSLITAQTKQELLNRLKSDPYKTVERVAGEGEIYKITDNLSGHTTYKNLTDKGAPKNNDVTTTTINFWELDTTDYQGIYYHWKDIDIYSGGGPELLEIEDVNNNGMLEIYGLKIDLEEDIINWGVFEFDILFENYNQIYQYPEEPDSICITNSISKIADIYDINGNGRKQLYLMSTCSTQGGPEPYSRGKVYSSNSINELPIQKEFEHIEISQINNSRFGDLNNDRVTDLIYYHDMANQVKINVYDPKENQFINEYFYQLTSSETYGEGFYIEDIDRDRMKEITFGGIQGDVWVFEYSPEDTSYNVSFRDFLDTWNLYVRFGTNDIDGNGKKEFWMGGDAFYNDVPKTMIYCYEPVGVDSFEIVHKIEINGLFSFWATGGAGSDLNNNGTEELFFYFENNIIIFEFTGSADKHEYNLYYYYNVPLGEPNYIKFVNARIYDVNRDGNKELLICKDSLPPGGGRMKGITSVLTNYDPTKAENAGKNNIYFNLYPNYPNPFNPITKISYTLANSEVVYIKVFNVLGQEIETLINKEQNSGKYEVDFDGSYLSNGIYLISMIAGEYSKTIKTLLIK